MYKGSDVVKFDCKEIPLSDVSSISILCEGQLVYPPVA